MTKNLKKRLTRIESAITPKVMGIMWVLRGEDFVRVEDTKMTLDEFNARYPDGVLIRVVEDGGLPDANHKDEI